MKKLVWILVLVLAAGGFVGCKKAEGPKEGATPSAAVKEYTFEEGIQGWKTIGKTQISQATDKQHGGKASLKIAGTGQSGQWSFARSEKFNISPGKHYKVAGWITIESISGNSSSLKCELWQDGKWLKNIESNWYDLKKREWQQLTAEFVTPEGKNLSLSFAIEKRPMDKDVKAVIYVDDIKLEMID